MRADYENLSPEQFEPKGPLFHGFASKPEGKRLETGSARGHTDYRISDSNRTYATNDKDLAWQYAEHKASMRLDMQAFTPTAERAFWSDWSTDVTKPGLATPNVAEVKLHGNIDVDPNVQLNGARPEELKAYRGVGGDIVGKPEFVPPGAQTTMVPNRKHGGRYVSSQQLGEQADARQWEKDRASDDEVRAQYDNETVLDAFHPKLFDDGMSRIEAIRQKPRRERRTSW